MRRHVDIHVCEVGLRDGLQLVKAILPTTAKTALLDMFADAGFVEIDVAGFVPPHIIPQFADAAAVMAHALALPNIRAGALVPNVKGASRAIAAGADVLYTVVSVSRAHNLANVRRTPDEQVASVREIDTLRKAAPIGARPQIVGGIATAFGCSLEGRIGLADVCRIAVGLREAGVDEITLADTVGYADPLLVKKTVADVKDAIGQDFPLRLHLHDTMGLGIANALAGLEAGVTRFDSAAGGLGGCPFAPGASGNIASEDLVFMLEQMGLRTGIDLERLLAATAALARLLPEERIRSHVREAGIPRIFGEAA
jgi:hydroxymethylglutaryl-CoA lyase